MIKRKVVVTGGAGFIGSHLVDELVRRNFQVVVIDDLSSGLVENLHKDAYLVQKDVSEDLCLEAFGGTITAVIHLAGLASVAEAEKNPAECYKRNVSGTANMLEACRIAGSNRFILSSSAAVCAEGSHVREEDPVEPVGPYGASKLAAEALVNGYGRWLSGINLRFFNVYGPRQSPSYAGVISAFAKAVKSGSQPVVYGDGTQSRDFVHVDDVVECMIRAIDAPQSAAGCYNVCTGETTSVNLLLRMIQAAAGTALSPRYEERKQGEIYLSSGDPFNAQAFLGFKAKTRLQEGINRTLPYL
jgi:UDP-glucose 4-epimerase